jgi:glycosyltransferase involved in cell wall biosynthesis
MNGANKEENRKIKVLYVLAALPVGGAEELLMTEVDGLDKQRFSPLVCVISEKGPIGELIEKMGIPVIPLHRMNKHQFDYRIIQDLYRLIRSENVQVVHTQLYDGNKYGRISAWLARVPCIISTYQNIYARRRIKYHLINWALSFVNDRIIAVSRAVKENVVHYDKISPEKVRVLYNCIDPSKFQRNSDGQEVRRRFGIGPEDYLIGVIGRLEEQKGHIYLLEALARLVSEFPQIKVLIVGKGNLRPFLEKKAQELGLSKNVLFLGVQKPINPILEALDLFLLPSLWEGFSLAILEAMSMGLPVVATAVGGAAEVIHSGIDGLLISPKDVPGLVAAIRDAVQHPKKFLEMGQNGKKTVSENFSQAHHLAMLQDLYLEVLNRKGILPIGGEL